MNQRLAAVSVLWAALCGACAPVRPDGVCDLPEVVRALDTELHRHGIYGTPDTRSFGELTGPEGGSTSCSVRLVVRGYDTNTYGDRPIDRVEVRSYSVTHLRNGLLVRLVR